MSKPKPHRCILIDPEACSISELESDLIDNIHELIGADTLGHFRFAEFENGHFDWGWVDDVGLSQGLPVYAFLLPTAKDPIAGKCLIIGADRHGETCSARFPLPLLRQDVTWLGLIKPEVHWDHTAQGSRAIVTYSRVKP